MTTAVAERDVDSLIAAFQRSVENLVSLERQPARVGLYRELSAALKERAILRNEIRAQLLALRSSREENERLRRELAAIFPGSKYADEFR